MNGLKIKFQATSDKLYVNIGHVYRSLIIVTIQTKFEGNLALLVIYVLIPLLFSTRYCAVQQGQQRFRGSEVDKYNCGHSLLYHG